MVLILPDTVQVLSLFNSVFGQFNNKEIITPKEPPMQLPQRENTRVKGIHEKDQSAVG